MITEKLYKNIVRKDLILKSIAIDNSEIPEIETLDIRIIFPKVVDDYSQLYEGVIFLEEFTGQFPIKKILSKKRVGAQEYEKNIIITSTLRKYNIFNFLLYFSIAIIFFWIETKEVIIMRYKEDFQNKIVQLTHKEFFYLFNMPIEYDDRQYEWKFQLIFHFKNQEIVNKNLLGCFLSYFFIYDILHLPLDENEIKFRYNQEEIENEQE